MNVPAARRLADEDADRAIRWPPTRCASSAIRWPSSSPRRRRRPRTPPRRSMLDIEALPAVTDAAPRRRSPARRRSTTTRRATSGARLPLRRRRDGERRPSPRPRTSRGCEIDQQPHRRLRHGAALGDRRLRRRRPSATPCTSAARACSACKRQLAGRCSTIKPRQGARADRQCRRLVRHEGLRSIPSTARCCTPRKMLGRPVKWTDERSESFLSDQHGRDHELRWPSWRSTRTARFLAVRLTGYRQRRRLHLSADVGR